MRAALLSLMLLAGPAGPGWADGPLPDLLSARETEALGALEVLRAAALAQAEGGAAADRAILDELVAAPLMPIDAGFDPLGVWRCRYIKLGGALDLTIYGWFRCRIFEDDLGSALHKETGSQRSFGRFYRLDAERLAYLGALYYAHEAPGARGDDPQRDQMGVLLRLGPDWLRLDFPAPLFESDFDMLELRR